MKPLTPHEARRMSNTELALEVSCEFGGWGRQLRAEVALNELVRRANLGILHSRSTVGAGR